jgi:sulfite dehydrogenase
VLVERSVPLKALEDALLAWEMNGEPLPLAHGGPLRLIVPGYQGVNNVKYVKRVALTREQSRAGIMATRYRMAPVGTKGNPSQPSVWEMGVKSWINGPLPEQGPLRAGWMQIHGVAFAGTRAVRAVEVSVDGGKNWQPAPFVGPDLGRFAWRQFALPVQLSAGTHVLASRAIDASGNVQPEGRVDNLDGYNNSSWQDHAVTVTVA